jgi:hypothetical protein
VQPGRKWLFVVGSWIVAVGATALVGEGILRLVGVYRLNYNIEMVRYARDLKQRDASGEVSHTHRPNASATLMGTSISLNSLGHRGPDLATKTGQSKRVLVLGSSVTLGWGVPFPEVFSSALETRLNREQPFGPATRFEFVNAGIGNYNTKFQYVLFKRQYPVVKPDFVILHYFIRDAEPIGMGRDNPLLKHSYLAAFLYHRIQLTSLGRRPSLFEHYRQIYGEGSPSWAETRAIVGEMKQTLDRDHVPLLVMIVPDIHDLSRTSPYGQLYATMEKAFSAAGVRTLNTYGAFQEKFGDREQDLWIQSDDPHPNAKGHALMADVAYKYLVEHDPLALAGSR